LNQLHVGCSRTRAAGDQRRRGDEMTTLALVAA